MKYQMELGFPILLMTTWLNFNSIYYKQVTRIETHEFVHATLRWQINFLEFFHPVG